MELKTHKKNLFGAEQTGAEMLRIAKTYSEDVAAFDCYTLSQFYDLVKSLTYKKDPPGIEHISRPAAILSKNAKFRDCDDKSTILASYILRKNAKARSGRSVIPFRFVGSSLREDGHLTHVFVEALINGRPRVLDATYPKNEMFAQKKYTAYKPLTGWVTNG